jgi:hypothetical protein
MYTGGKVNRVLQPVALCVVLVFGSLPAATLACQWACGPDLAVAHHHTGHHGGHVTYPSTLPTDGFSIASSTPLCDHSDSRIAAVISAVLKMYAPVAVDVEAPGSAAHAQSAASTIVYAPHSPGGRSAPLPLRI